MVVLVDIFGVVLVWFIVLSLSIKSFIFGCVVGLFVLFLWLLFGGFWFVLCFVVLLGVLFVFVVFVVSFILFRFGLTLLLFSLLFGLS